MAVFKVPFSQRWTETRAGEGNGETLSSVPYWDWTFCTDYCCSISVDTNLSLGSSEFSGSARKNIVCGRKLSISTTREPGSGSPLSALGPRPNPAPHWMRCQSSGIEMHLLQQREDPILFFDDIMLYQVQI